ncbi:MAG: hypothetical protein ACLUE2_03595 [Bacteroides cellulosilyticus]
MSWSLPASTHVATYSKVAPGSYVFHVKSVIDGVDQKERIIYVTVAEPWWNTIWARLVYLALFSCFFSIFTG